MKFMGLQKGDEAYVSVKINRRNIADIVVNAISSNEISEEIWCDTDADMVAVYEALKAACSGVDYQLQRPHLREMLAERIAQLKSEDEEAEGKPPCPDDLCDIPF